MAPRLHWVVSVPFFLRIDMFIRLCKTVRDFGILIKEDQVLDHIDSDNDWYQSVYYYNDEQYANFQRTGTVKGVKDVVANKILFDVDAKGNLQKAQDETRKLITNLQLVGGVKATDMEIYFSGNKGFHVLFKLNNFYSPEELQNIVSNILKGQTFECIDPSVYDCTQILRIAGTKHNETGLYKIPLSFVDMFNLSVDEIKNRAANLDNITEEFNPQTVPETSLPPEWFKFTKVEPQLNMMEYTLDLSEKPKHWKNCKYSLLQGNFKEGERHNALLVLAATCRGLGYDKDTTYYLCKSALKKQATISGQDEFDKSELWNNIIKDSVFKDGWSGGQFSCKTDPWLHKYCENLGSHKCKDRNEDPGTITFMDMGNKFLDYAKNFEQNVIKTGLAELDNNATFLASTLVGLLGQPGAGKTSVGINYLKNTSLNNIPSMFFSLDMGMPIVFAKLVQKETGWSFKRVMEMYKTDPQQRDKMNEIIKEQYKNVGFNFKSGLTVSDIKTNILDHQEITGKAVKLVVVDYLECIAGPYSDTLANTGLIANQLKDLANETNTCVLLLLQTQKHSTPNVSDPLLSLKNVKGSSVLEQSMSSILTLWREGYSPSTVEDDRYISFAIVKNRFGSLWQGDFSWNGATGDIRSLTQEQREHLKQFKQWKKQQAAQSDGGGGWS